MGFDLLFWVLSYYEPVLCSLCSSTLWSFLTRDMCPQPALNKSVKNLHWRGILRPFFGRSVEIPWLKQNKIYNLEQLRQTRTHTRIIWWIDSQIEAIEVPHLLGYLGICLNPGHKCHRWQVLDLAGCTNSAKWRWRYWIAWKILKDLRVSMGLRAEKKRWQKGCHQDSDGCQEIQEGQKEPPPQVWSNKSIIHRTDLYIDSWSQQGCFIGVTHLIMGPLVIYMF